MKFIIPLIACLATPTLLPAHSKPSDLTTSVGGFAITFTVGLKIEPTEEKPVAKKAAKPRKVSKPARAAKPKPKRVVYDLAGTWDWVAQCKVWGRVNGVSVYKKNGTNKYVGASKSATLANQVKLTVTQKGRDFVQNERLGLIRAKGQMRFAANGRSFEGTVTNGCAVKATKR